MESENLILPRPVIMTKPSGSLHMALDVKCLPIFFEEYFKTQAFDLYRGIREIGGPQMLPSGPLECRCIRIFTVPGKEEMANRWQLMLTDEQKDGLLQNILVSLTSKAETHILVYDEKAPSDYAHFNRWGVLFQFDYTVRAPITEAHPFYKVRGMSPLFSDATLYMTSNDPEPGGCMQMLRIKEKDDIWLYMQDFENRFLLMEKKPPGIFSQKFTHVNDFLRDPDLLKLFWGSVDMDKFMKLSKEILPYLLQQ